jgi:hypothetical protein
LLFCFVGCWFEWHMILFVSRLWFQQWYHLLPLLKILATAVPVEIWYPICWSQLTKFHWFGLICSSFDRGEEGDHFPRLGSIYFYWIKRYEWIWVKRCVMLDWHPILTGYLTRCSRIASICRWIDTWVHSTTVE